eukprot:1183983-Prorocentrum_minimum.AAC.6
MSTEFREWCNGSAAAAMRLVEAHKVKGLVLVAAYDDGVHPTSKSHLLRIFLVISFCARRSASCDTRSTGPEPVRSASCDTRSTGPEPVRSASCDTRSTGPEPQAPYVNGRYAVDTYLAISPCIARARLRTMFVSPSA